MAKAKRSPARLETTPTASSSSLRQVRLELPVWYIRVCEREAESMGMRRRSQFLSMLVRRASGQLFTQRSPALPKVAPPKLKDLDETAHWLWHCPPEEMAVFEDLRRRSGGINAQAWFLAQINLWLGFPALGPLVPPLPAA